MKLLVVTPYFYPKMGGLENYAYNICLGLKEKYKWDIVVVTSNHKDKKDIVENISGMKVFRLAPLFKLSNTPINPFWYWKIKKIIAQEKPDMINAHSPVPFIADMAALAAGKIPFVLTYHAGSMKKGKIIFDLIINIYEKFALSYLFKKSTNVICASKFVKNSLVKYYNSKNTVISPAVDTHIFKPGKNKKQNAVLFVGRHANVYPLKGLPYLLDAMKDIPNATLTIVGEKIKTKQKNVKFVGIKSGEKLVEEMQKSSILVLPSVAPMESFGMVLIEAMACKTPVIGTRIGGIPEIIKNGKNGLLVNIQNSLELKNAIIKILHDSKTAKEMGDRGYQTVMDHYLWQTKVTETNRILNLLLN